jgi:hypothetical protein
MSPAAQCRLAGAVLGVGFLLVLPGVLLGPVIFGGASLEALSAWVLPASCVSAAFGMWHLVTAAFAYEEDIEFITGYFQAQDAAPLVLPFVLFVGTRSVYRRFFAPALVARRRWHVRRTERLRRERSAVVSAGGENAFPNTVPREP